jgi:hypothetical protein
MLYSGALAQQAPAISSYAFERGFPTQEGAQRAGDDANYQRAVIAYRFWYPTVSMEATFQGTRDAGLEDNKAAMILAGAATLKRRPASTSRRVTAGSRRRSPFLRRCFCAPRAPARSMDRATRTAPISTAARPTSSPCRGRPQKLFWSVTVYDSGTRSQIQTDQHKAALRSLVELKDVATSGTADLYFGPNAPAGQESRWIKTNPGNGWFVYFRLYDRPSA